MEEVRDPRVPFVQRVLRWLRPPRVYFTPDTPAYLAEELQRQFEEDLDTRRLKALRL